MAMGQIGKAMKSTRTQMIESETNETAREFSRKFKMKDGDFIRYRKEDAYWKRARIMSVEKVYWNQGGGITADVVVAPLLENGRLGKTRCLLLVVDADGSNLRGVHYCDHVERVEKN